MKGVLPYYFSKKKVIADSIHLTLFHSENLKTLMKLSKIRVI